MKDLQSELNAAIEAESAYNDWNSQVELEEHNLHLIAQRVSESQFAILSEKLKTDSDGLEDSILAVDSAKKAATDLTEEIADVEVRLRVQGIF